MKKELNKVCIYNIPLQKPCSFHCKNRENKKYTAKVSQDNVNRSVVTIFRLVNTSLHQVY